MDKHLNEEQIAQCADAIISGKYGNLNSQLRNHLANCDECAAEVLNVTDLTIDFQTDAPKGTSVNFKPWILAISSLAAGLLIFFLIPNLLNQPNTTADLAIANEDKTLLLEKTDSSKQDFTRPTEEEIFAEVNVNETIISPAQEKPNQKLEDTKTQQAKSNLHSGAYTPDETLEMLFQNFTQAYRGEDIVVLSNGITELSENDSLKWSNPSKEELYIEFYNNKGNRFLTLSERSSGVKIPELEFGLYYWKLINKEFDLLFVGKIFVE